MTSVTFEEQGGRTLPAVHELYSSTEALDGPMAAGTEAGTARRTNNWGRAFVLHLGRRQVCTVGRAAVMSVRFPWTVTVFLFATTVVGCTSRRTSDFTNPDVATKPSSDAREVAKAPAGAFTGAYSSPSVVRQGTTFHAYFAAQRIDGRHYNIPHVTFTSASAVSFVGEALPHLGVRAAQSSEDDPVWAPAAARIDPTHWMLYYTARLENAGAKKCIWRAHAAGPDGPFVDDYAGPLECEPSTLWAIDPYLVEAGDGRWYLAARIDRPGRINTIQLRELAAGAADYAAGSSWTELTENSPSSWEHPVLENAGVVRLAPPHREPHWFVFYSGRAWSDDTYAIGYADCGVRIEGPCVKKTPEGPWLATDANAGVFGPGTPTFYGDGNGTTWMSVQAWEHSGGLKNPLNHGQIMRTYKVTIDDDYRPTAAIQRVDK